ncbi:putative F-box/FBD/LRR-repeat protein at4g13965 [Phtheirospermum japonicum]|uniref:Putative F-box/FBD/LRR-repeat protein at4g13965 n=1 Tax=Phtheirospermum japonicum TaxID=374723 RepID=A0A830CYZ3_9LAMI|nr:putative F-box/FBD/LRR-repeat protein at4g13965 [Phtheirospermum japonicum]
MASVDRLSALPDHVLCHILSFLPTKTSVKTSILSTRWSFIWAHVPTLDFHHKDYHTATYLPNIVSRVMSLHKVQTLDSLRLIFQDCSDFELETLIIIAKSRNVRNLDIEVDSEYTLPRRLFTFTTLVRLTLSGFPCIYKTGGDVHLPRLKRLHLDYLLFQVDEDLPRLLSGCPVLEDLTLDLVRFSKKKLGCFNVSSSALKRLTITVIGSNYLDSRVEINAPALRYLKVCCWSSSISVSPMTSLIEADIDMSFRLTDDHYISRMKFLNYLCHVKCLSLRAKYDEEFVDMALAGPMVRFDNLTKLVYGSVGDWHLFGKLLKVANNLKVLTVSKFPVLGSKDTYRWWEEPGQVPACLSSHLRTIRISGMSAVESEQRNMVRYLLENAKVLKRMEIYLKCRSGSLSKQRSKLVEFLSSFVRASQACELVIRRDNK